MKTTKSVVLIALSILLAFSTMTVAFAEENLSTETSSASVTAVAEAENFQLSKESYTFDGEEKCPKVSVYDTEGKRIKSDYFEVDYSSNKNPGTAKVNVQMKAPYVGAKKLTFKITLKAPNTPKLIQMKQKQLTINLSESKGVDGYEVKYSTSSKMKKAKTVKVKNTDGLQYTVTGLKNEKTYYVKVRSYLSVKGKKVYSNWSKITSKKVTKRAPQHDLPTEMLESYVLDSMDYIGYNVKRQWKNGTLLQDRASGPRTPMADRSGIVYNGTPSGLETVKDKSTVSGKAPNLKKFRRYGLVCASYVTYYYLNYLPNIAGVDTDYIRKAVKKSGYDPQTCDAWYKAANSLVKQGKAKVVDRVPRGSSLSAADLDKLQIGDLLCFSVPNQGVTCGHVAVYAGTNNGEHFVAHVGSDEGPVFQTLQRFENVVHEHDGCAYSVVYRFKDLPNSKYDYSVKTEKSSYKLKKGKAVEPELIVKDATGKDIDPKNYTVYYKSNKKIGIGKAIVVFKGKYKGTKTVKFKIKK